MDERANSRSKMIYPACISGSSDVVMLDLFLYQFQLIETAQLFSVDVHDHIASFALSQISAATACCRYS